MAGVKFWYRGGKVDPTDDIDLALENARRIEREILLKLGRIEDALNHVEADLPEEDPE
jgi:hypothetical protein